MRSCSRVRWRLAAVMVVALSASWPTPGLAASSAGWRWPLAGTPTVLRPFQPPPTPYAAGHRGVDLAALSGAAVLAAGDGVIGYAGSLAGRGVVTVVHGALRTTYEPVAAVVHAGQRVAAGAAIGRLQPPTGHCGPGRSCLHWGLLRGDLYLNPLALLGLTHSILLPLWGRDSVAGAGPAPLAAAEPARSAEEASSAGPLRPSRRPPSRRPPWLPIGGTAALLGAGLLGAGLLSPPRRWPGLRSRYD